MLLSCVSNQLLNASLRPFCLKRSKNVFQVEGRSLSFSKKLIFYAYVNIFHYMPVNVKMTVFFFLNQVTLDKYDIQMISLINANVY